MGLSGVITDFKTTNCAICSQQSGPQTCGDVATIRARDCPGYNKNLHHIKSSGLLTYRVSQTTKY